MRIIGLLFILYFGVVSISFAQYEHFKQGYTCKNYDTLGTYYKMVSWDDSQYEQFTYFVTENATGPVQDFMNYRLIFPNDYDDSGNTKYPMIVMLHGAGESGRSWSGHYIYYPGDPEYDNNGKQLLHGGREHRDAVNRDPSNSRAFPGFVLFPQTQNNGNWENGWDDGNLSPRNSKAVKIIENIIDNFNINANKIYVHGLSNGAKGVWDIVSKRPDLFAAYLPMSGVGRELTIQPQIVTTIPIWLFQGGKDSNPLPNAAEDWINAITALGGRPRYTLYPNLGHGTWSTAYAESDFFSWMLEQDKRNIFVFGGNGETELCPGGQLTLGFSEGFLAYQWTKDGVDIPGETTTRLNVTEVGTYAIKYQRRNGADSLTWDVSYDLEITPKSESTYKPPVVVDGSLALPTPFKVGLTLSGPVGYSNYTWYQDGMLELSSSSSDLTVVPSYSTGDDPALAGSYTLSVTEPSGCESLESDPIVVSHGNGANAPVAPSNVVATVVSASEMDVTWNDNSNNEDYFEVWYAYNFGADTPPFSGWQMLTTLPANTTSFQHTGLLPETNYGYFIRATNYDGANNSSQSSHPFTLPDLIAPSVPYNLVTTGIGADTVAIEWDPSYDNISVNGYSVYMNGDSIGYTSSASYVLSNLQPLTSYSISVRALDYSDNYSSYSSALWVTTNEADPGLTYNIYDHGGWSTLVSLDFGSLTPTSSGVISTFDISERQGTDYYGYTFDGYIKITTIGTYTFYTSSDDGSMLYIEGTEVVNNDGTHGTITESGTYDFTTPGYYAIRVEFFENGGGDNLTVQYNGADTGSSTIAIPSSILFQNAPPQYNIFYSTSSGDLADVNNWGSNPTGSGTNPSDFTSDFQTFIIANRTSTSLENPWTVSGTGSKVIISGGITLTLNEQLSGLVEVEDLSTLNLNNANPPRIGECGVSSVVNVNTDMSVPQGFYGSLNIVGSQAQFSNSTTFVQTNFDADASSTVKGGLDNTSILNVSGDITFNSSLAGIASSEYFSLNIVGSGTHLVSLPPEDVSFYELNSDFGAIIMLENNTSSTTTLTLGSSIGGGLSLEGSSELILNDVNLNIIGAGAINPGIETGVVSVDSTNITIASTTDLNSNLYFDGVNRMVNNLDIDLSGNGNLTLYNGAEVANKIKINNGELNANNSLTLLGSDTKTAFIDEIELGGSIIGTMKMQRHIRQGRYWRYFSSPFSGATVSDWQQTMPITGNFDGTSVIDGVVSSSPSMYYYDETQGLGDNGWVVYPPNGGTNAAVIEPGVGYALFVRADTDVLVFDMPGVPNQGDFTFNLTSDPTPGSGVTPNDGWSLIGNPYASTIRWDIDGNGWTSSGINDVVYVRDNEDPSLWKYYDRDSGLGTLTDGEIAPGQAFYVRATSSVPVLIISENAKSSGQPSFYRETAPQNYVTIYMHSSNGSDVSYVIMKNENDDMYEVEHDGIKRESSTYSISTLSSDNVPLSINKLSNQFCSKSVNISISNVEPGNYSLEFSDLESFEVPMSITLIDNFTSTEQNLLSSDIYGFEVTENSDSYGDNRFVLEFVVNEIGNLSQIQGQSSCDHSAPIVLLDGTSENINYQVFENDEPVSEVYTGQENNSTSIEIDPELLEDGSHIFTVKAWNDVCETKYNMGEVFLDFYNLSVDLSEDNGTLVSSSDAGNQWLLNGEIIEGATSKTYAPSETGDYSVLVTFGECQLESSPIVFVVTGIKDGVIKEVSVYPNPVNDYLTIQINNTQTLNGKLKIYNSNGRLILEGSLFENKSQLNVNSLPKGLYLIKVISDKDVYEGKFFK